MAEAQADAAMGRAITRTVRTNVVEPLSEFLERHKLLAKGVTVAADVAGVIGGVAAVIVLAPAEVTAGVVVATAFAVTAGVASAALLWEDSRIYYFEIAGDKVRVDDIENDPNYKRIQHVGPLLLLPDLLYSGPGLIRELSEAKELAGTAKEAAFAAGEQSKTAAEVRDAYAMQEAQNSRKLNRYRHRARLRADQYSKMQENAEALNRLLHAKLVASPAYPGSVWSELIYVNELAVPNVGKPSGATATFKGSIGAGHGASTPNSQSSMAGRSSKPGQLEFSIGAATRPE